MKTIFNFIGHSVALSVMTLATCEKIDNLNVGSFFSQDELNWVQKNGKTDLDLVDLFKIKAVEVTTDELFDFDKNMKLEYIQTGIHRTV